MAWKNIKLRTFADGLINVHRAVEELDGVHGLVRNPLIYNLSFN